MDVNDLIKQIVNKYFEFYDIEPFEIDVHITNSLSETYIKLRPDHINFFSKEELNKFNELHATIALPKKKTDPFCVILSDNYLRECVGKGNEDYIGTIAHEITHIIDYKTYYRISKAYNYDDIQSIKNNDRNYMFSQWTEYNARRQGYYFLRSIVWGEDIKGEESIEHIINTELPFHINHLTEVFESGDSYSKMYTTMQFLGRLRVWEDLFPDVFTPYLIHELLSSNLWIEELHDFFVSYDTLSKVYDRFEELKTILSHSFIFDWYLVVDKWEARLID